MRAFGDFEDYTEMWDAYLVEFCSPTLAGLKPANLFNISYKTREELQFQLNRMSNLCESRGVKIKLMRIRKKKALIYVYRESMLEKIMMMNCIWNLLEQCGYQQGSIEVILEHLKKRMGQFDDFPHEIGIFLGYPYGDVIGFIKNTGRNCLCCGYWKVYENEQECRMLFQAYDACKKAYQKSFYSGTSLLQLIAG